MTFVVNAVNISRKQRERKGVYFAARSAEKSGGILTLNRYIKKRYTNLYARTAIAVSKPTAIEKGNTAPTSAIFPTVLEVAKMTENEKLYYISLSVAKEMLSQGVISEKSYQVIATKLLEKYNPVSAVLLSGNPLTL